MTGMLTALIGLTFTTTLIVKEIAYQKRAILGRVEEMRREEIFQLDRLMNLRNVVASDNPEQYVKNLMAGKEGLKVYVAEGLMNGDPCQRMPELNVKTREGIVRDVAYVIVSSEGRSERVLNPIRGILDLSAERGALKIVKYSDFRKNRCPETNR